MLELLKDEGLEKKKAFLQAHKGEYELVSTLTYIRNDECGVIDKAHIEACITSRCDIKYPLFNYNGDNPMRTWTEWLSLIEPIDHLQAASMLYKVGMFPAIEYDRMIQRSRKAVHVGFNSWDDYARSIGVI